MLRGHLESDGDRMAGRQREDDPLRRAMLHLRGELSDQDRHWPIARAQTQSQRMKATYRRKTDRPEVSSDERRQQWLFGLCRQVDVACSQWLAEHGIRINGTHSHSEACDALQGTMEAKNGESGQPPPGVGQKSGTFDSTPRRVKSSYTSKNNEKRVIGLPVCANPENR
jgi:hypothetical protein